jgi:glutathione-specific gamma-glutamylcyclotransferase
MEVQRTGPQGTTAIPDDGALADEGTPASDGLWVFGYGSLMWDPGFAHAESRRALLHGYHRALCILSIRNRGTIERPGLALGLNRGGSCRGIAFRIRDRDAADAKAYLWEREMGTGAYEAKALPIRLNPSERVHALVFVARPGHPQHVGDLPPEEAARLVIQGIGTYGAALDYLRNVIRHLDEFGIPDCPLHRILALAERQVAPANRDGNTP